MHGRLKVKTTAQQQEEKRKERETKLAVFRQVIAKATEKRSAEEYDAEALEIVHKLLLANPDLTTMWNFDKEILLHMKKTKEEGEVNDLFKEELSFTESCLRVNPKSYGAWYHRCWVLDTMPNPDWNKELGLCDRYLALDERNFHCWDYRKFVVQRSNVPPEEELKFTMQLINNNFSNYSAWHYRSKLLPLVYPDQKGRLSINEDAHLRELDLVQNAAFTDPNDQSAWFYHRWLLGRDEQPVNLLCMYVNRLSNSVVISATKPFTVGSSCSISLTIDDKEIETNWKPSCPNTATAVWASNLQSNSFQDSSSHLITVSIPEWTSTLSVRLESNAEDVWTFYDFVTKDYSRFFRMELSAATTSVLEQELASCEQLQELEPDNKWTVLTSVLLMRAINPDKFKNQTTTYLNKLVELDSNRENYAKDLYSKFAIEDFLRHFHLTERNVNLAEKQLTTLYYPEYFILITTINLSNNSLKSLDCLHALKNLRHLNADHNSIDNCSGLEYLPLLETTSICHNQLTNTEALLALASCTKLLTLKLTGNPICKQNSLLDQWIKENFPNIKCVLL